MLAFVYADRSVLSKSAALLSARTGDLILYAAAPPPKRPSPATADRRRRSREFVADEDYYVPTVGATPPELAAGHLSCTSLLAMLMPAIALSDGEREASRDVDCVGVVVEKPASDESCVLIYDANRRLILLPLSCIINRPACLRPLLLVGDGKSSNAHAASRRQALHKFLARSVDDLCADRLSTVTHERTMQSQTYLAAHLLYAAGVLAVPPHEFCAPRELAHREGDGVQDAAFLFGAETLHLDMSVTRDYAYGNPIWLS